MKTPQRNGQSSKGSILVAEATFPQGHGQRLYIQRDGKVCRLESDSGDSRSMSPRRALGVVVRFLAEADSVGWEDAGLAKLRATAGQL